MHSVQWIVSSPQALHKCRPWLDQTLSSLKSCDPPHPDSAPAFLSTRALFTQRSARLHPFYSIPCCRIASLTKLLPGPPPQNSLAHPRPYLTQVLPISGSAHPKASPVPQQDHPTAGSAHPRPCPFQGIESWNPD